MKLLLFALLFFAIPTVAIAENLPANFMVYRGKVLNLDHLWGKGIKPPPVIIKPVAQVTEPREFSANSNRVAHENARGLILMEYLRNSR